MNMIKLTFMAPSYCKLHFIYSLIDYLCCLCLSNSFKCLDIFTRNQNKTKNIDTLQKWLLNKYSVSIYFPTLSGACYLLYNKKNWVFL